MTDIANAASVTERTFFRYFPTKDAVLLHRSRERFDILGTALLAHVDVAAPTWAALDAALAAYASEVDDGGSRFDLVLRVLYTEPALRARLREHRTLWQEWAAEVLARRGPRVPAEVIAALVLAIIRAGHEAWVGGARAEPLTAAMARAVDEARRALPHD